MNDFSQCIPSHIRKLVERNQSKPLNQSHGSTKPIALNLNENPFGPSPLALKALEAAISNIHRYPEIHALDLHQEIAGFHGVNAEQVLVTAGATELLCMIARVLLGPGLEAVTSACSFIVYKLATQVTEGRFVEVPTCDNAYDLDAIAKAIDANTRIVFISNPNNPTGTVATADEIDRFIGKIPGHVLVVLDEAYGDFAADFAERRGVTYSRALDHVRADRNLILLKTFSKAHGLAGLRVGYGIGPARLISVFAQVRSIFSVSSVAQAAALAALRDQEHISRAIENNSEQSEVLIANLNELGYSVPPTWANFVYCELGEDAARFAERLQAHGVVVQPLGLWGAPTAIRISVGTPEQNRRFLDAFEEVA
ncbi:MAG: histidinol-phosphate transaminase [Acidobacteria bacterium]|nr:MAG: histidinol-phosphate transaminase [Acidobacteriota bacterium]PYV76822.1 MAG: histidinol-phosphate transaminase [Acidobacteriota bacterium]